MSKNKIKKTNDSLVIPIEEEYGYRHWYWIYPGTVQELIQDWKDGKAPINFFNPSVGDYKGEMILVDDGEIREFYNLFRHSIRAHVHEEEDTYLQVGEDFFSPTYKY